MGVHLCNGIHACRCTCVPPTLPPHPHSFSGSVKPDVFCATCNGIPKHLCSERFGDNAIGRQGRSTAGSCGSGATSQARIVRMFVPMWAPQEKNACVLAPYCHYAGTSLAPLWYHTRAALETHWPHHGTAMALHWHDICTAPAVTGTALELHWNCTAIHWHNADTALAL